LSTEGKGKAKTEKDEEGVSEHLVESKGKFTRDGE